MRENFNVQVIATKTKIYLIMEYASGGQLTDRMVSELKSFCLLLFFDGCLISCR